MSETTIHPRTPISFEVVQERWFVLGKHIMGKNLGGAPDVEYHAVWTRANGETQKCSHAHQSERTAIKCGRTGIRRGNTWSH